MIIAAIALAIIAAVIDYAFGIPEPWKKLIYIGVVILLVIGVVMLLLPGLVPLRFNY